MKHKLQSILRFLNRNKYYIILFIILSICAALVANSYVESVVNESRNDLLDDISYGVFENKSTFGVRDKSYTIVSYEKAQLPEQHIYTDSSAYNQQYGGIEKYYKARGGWTIYIYEKRGEDIVVKSISPYAVGIGKGYSYYSKDPDQLFRVLYNNIVADEDYNVSTDNSNRVAKLKASETAFHRLEKSEFEYGESLMWYDLGSNKAYSNIKHIASYQIINKYDKIEMWTSIAVISSIIVCALFVFIIKKIFGKKKGKSKSRFNFGITINKSSEEESPQVTNDDITALLEKINPSNFMSPYDAEKVKIANDLYSALLNANGNKTIIAMIRDKAISDLQIEL